MRPAQLGHSVYMIAITGYGQPDDRRRPLEAGFDLHLIKPVDTQVLERLLSREILELVCRWVLREQRAGAGHRAW